MSRRAFVAQAGLYAASLPLLSGQGRSARAANVAQGSAGVAGDLHPSHHVPVDKGLDPAWIERLLAPGEPRVYQGKELQHVGMPVGGIGTGQLYLGGDGRLLHWDIFNRHFNSAAVNTYPAQVQELTQPVAQGFALRIRDGEQTVERALDSSGFQNVRFVGEYPIGTVDYRDESLPVQTRLTAFSPFIPLNAEDSGQPVTVMRFTLKNTSDRPVEASLAGWLANAVCHQGTTPPGVWRNEVSRDGGLTFVDMSFEPHEPAPREDNARPPIVFADFEQESYGDWQAEGEALGSGPARGTIPPQQPVSGYEGERLVNTFLGGDGPTGTLTSPPFTIERKYINFLIGGGSDPEKFGMRLIVDGETVRRATAKNDEKLEWTTWWVEDLAGKEARLEIYDKGSGPWGHINIDQIEFSDAPHLEQGAARSRHDFGTMGLGVLGQSEGVLATALLPEGRRPEALFADDGSLAGDTQQAATMNTVGGQCGVGRALALKPGQSADVDFIIAWHFPNLTPGGRYYANRFDNARAAAGYVAHNLPSLAEQTQRWHDTYYNSTLPHWLLDRLHMPISTLATSTCQWWKNGRFWAWEGVGCCAGTCTHVWNYEQAMARLFPQLEQSVRHMQDFEAEAGFQPLTGLVGFRGEHHMAYAADGQCGTILKAYREHLISRDDGFLKEHWPQIRKALEFLAVQDADLDGIITNQQHNTYDIEFYGPNTFVGALYLAALLAAERMAAIMGEEALAKTCRKAFEEGSKFSMDRLFDGEYFFQRVDLHQHPVFQYNRGCLADQLFGQNWAHQLGLGYLYPTEAVRSGVESVWRYNWAPDVGTQNEMHPAGRLFAEPGEPGLFICTWPKSPHLGDAAMRYKNEVWTGIEYEVAAGMIYEGLLDEAMVVVKSIDQRYDASKRNPWNEIECGDHYARAMASWGVLLALSGFEYDGPTGRLAMGPRMSPDDFRCAFTGAEGWGTLEQRRKDGEQTNTVTVRWGRLRLDEVDVILPSPVEGEVSLLVNGQPVEATAQPGEANRLHIQLGQPLVLEENDSLQIRVPTAQS